MLILQWSAQDQYRHSGSNVPTAKRLVFKRVGNKSEHRSWIKVKLKKPFPNMSAPSIEKTKVFLHQRKRVYMCNMRSLTLESLHGIVGIWVERDSKL